MFTLKDAMAADIESTFFSQDEFGVPAVINGVLMTIVPDDHALKKYNLKAEGEGLARGELLFYAPVSLFVSKPFIGMEIAVDDEDYVILSITEGIGVYEIVLEGYHA